jgi:endonuclease V-like protein UPF0215 family
LERYNEYARNVFYENQGGHAKNVYQRAACITQTVAQEIIKVASLVSNMPEALNEEAFLVALGISHLE